MKRQISLDEYDFTNGYLTVFFKLDNGEYREDIIDENTFEEYIEKSGRLEYFEDCWDAYTESHYTKDYILNYYDWRDEYCESNDILDFLYYYYKNNKIPYPLKE
jgi:hypothetical protein